MTPSGHFSAAVMVTKYTLSTCAFLSWHTMLPPFQELPTQDGNKCKLLYLTSAQANLIAASGKIQNLIDAFEMPSAKLVIQFLRSVGGVSWFNGLSSDMLDIAQGWRGGSYKGIPPWVTIRHAYEAEDKLVAFMQQVIIPLAGTSLPLYLSETQYCRKWTRM